MRPGNLLVVAFEGTDETIMLRTAARVWWRIAKEANIIGDTTFRDSALVRVREIALVANDGRI